MFPLSGAIQTVTAGKELQWWSRGDQEEGIEVLFLECWTLLKEAFYRTWIGLLTYLAPKLNSLIISLVREQNITIQNHIFPLCLWKYYSMYID